MKNETFAIQEAKGRPMLHWVGKKPLSSIEYYPSQEKEVYGNKKADWFNRLYWGDNLQVLSHLLKEFRGKVDLIYIDPPFDSKADYVKKVKIKGQEVMGSGLGLLEEKQYTDMWDNDEYLQFMYERLLIMKELLSDNGVIFLHCDYHKGHYLRCILNEVFGEENFVNEIIWHYTGNSVPTKCFPRKHDNIFFYSKNKDFNIDFSDVLLPYADLTLKRYNHTDEEGKKFKISALRNGQQEKIYAKEGKFPDDVWDIPVIRSIEEKLDYPTQKPEPLLERLIKVSSQEGDIVLDCFMGSGTTCAVAQKLGRRWIGCDINIGAIQTTTKRLNQIIDSSKDKLTGFKIYNVNEYDIFKNELEAKEIIMELYGVETIKRSPFDGFLDQNFVKVMPLNRVLNKLDIKGILKTIEEKSSSFTPKKTSKQGETTYEEGVLVICSGAENDVYDYLKKENHTGIEVDIRDILRDKQNLVFKAKPEAEISCALVDKKLNIMINEFISPLLLRKMEIENEKRLNKEDITRIEDFKQVIDSVAIDVDYDDKLFNAEIIDAPSKKEEIKGSYEWNYEKKGPQKVAVKIVDILGEEYFEVFTLN